MLKGSRGRRVSELSCAFLCLLNFASFDNCEESNSLGFTKSWVGQVALRSPINRHALDLVVSLDDQGH